MPRLVLSIEQDERDALIRYAQSQLRDPHEQLRFVLRQTLIGHGLLTSDPIQSDAERTVRVPEPFTSLADKTNPSVGAGGADAARMFAPALPAYHDLQMERGDKAGARFEAELLSLRKLNDKRVLSLSFLCMKYKKVLKYKKIRRKAPGAFDNRKRELGGAFAAYEAHAMQVAQFILLKRDAGEPVLGGIRPRSRR
jgi:hypothetical protein